MIYPQPTSNINPVMKKLNADKKELVADLIAQLLDDTVDIEDIRNSDDERLFAAAELPVIEYAIKLLEARKKENEKLCAKAA